MIVCVCVFMRASEVWKDGRDSLEASYTQAASKLVHASMAQVGCQAGDMGVHIGANASRLLH
jgi:hypothetical protein